MDWGLKARLRVKKLIHVSKGDVQLMPVNLNPDASTLLSSSLHFKRGLIIWKVLARVSLGIYYAVINWKEQQGSTTAAWPPIQPIDEYAARLFQVSLHSAFYGLESPS